ncbi:MAG TPA: hypothetical protein VGE09_02625 [Pseudoxanthomonas sp.]
MSAAFPRRVKCVLGETGVPWTWEYGDKVFVLWHLCAPQRRGTPRRSGKVRT